jgi:hypothetical protein
MYNHFVAYSHNYVCTYIRSTMMVPATWNSGQVVRLEHCARNQHQLYHTSSCFNPPRCISMASVIFTCSVTVPSLHLDDLGPSRESPICTRSGVRIRKSEHVSHTWPKFMVLLRCPVCMCVCLHLTDIQNMQRRMRPARPGNPLVDLLVIW